MAHEPANGTNGVSSPKILAAEKVSPDGIAILQKHFPVDSQLGLSAEELLNKIPAYDALIVRSETKVTAELLAAGKNLKVVARAGVGVDNVDVPAATRLGIVVVNSPSGNIRAAAEHTIALLLSTARNIPDGCASLKNGKWERSRLVGIEAQGKTLGIIGLGKVGLQVARMATGLGMTVNALDPYASAAIAQNAQVTMMPSIDDLLPTADFLTIHTPLIATTKGMIGAKELAKMKKGSRILNVARGGVIDEATLLEAINGGHIAGAGIDVWTTEPPEKDSPAAKLIAHPAVVSTPHLGASTREAQENVSIDVCEQVFAILSGDLPRSAVNAPMILPEEYKTLQPFVKLVEKMGSLYTQHYSKPPSATRLQDASAQPWEARTRFDLAYEGSLATLKNTKPLFAALVKGLTASITSTNVTIVNAEMVARERGITISEQLSRTPTDQPYSSLVTLKARPAASSRASSRRPGGPTAEGPVKNSAEEEQVICGYVAGGQAYISKLDRFACSFVPEGTLLICHNYDSPGKIGKVGGFLGEEGVNINFMSVAPVSQDAETARNAGEAGKEALMIIGVDREINRDVEKKIAEQEGILDVSVATL